MLLLVNASVLFVLMVVLPPEDHQPALIGFTACAVVAAWHQWRQERPSQSGRHSERAT